MKTTTLYELVYIARDEADTATDKVKSYITGSKGTVEGERKWGKKRFAYPIKKETSGFYFLWDISMGQDTIAPFKRKLDLDENVLRYLLIKKDK
ncbi:30S ribosomal protein S6 [Candidatus Roizmanbacteria bacterium RIFCSPHIGHO2_02_FULL_40_13b]|uniref:Small ribosomal subunit protein bS6 n=1 Tax=Candidatus Roizmanbacteria bacterium RIFCSPHIGHO2_01_FULL_39_24 TaxID=1802032 RepID=A0A1F7GEG5_9BACT|nr:MAG: 30S ribosomal protein S6 [Candidatus Roizmanbacteria bacterium RIFCSPHIGHO2_01_FULL_39_24]OGK26229.1 MAG: 30S ribosomal protein S6 [Candidatus Roizmanbacteria bacterium RIFCSPHIGHO2_02_FULL_40_13b]OGK50381.1 MAG: 30S ribosomal protein S6 [Candidatus Roizmanbacteria bacterium RIFCSPLOWO2_01_FULL_40_32]OGK56223.1 MAG: 30S ribosomal protein S6 [Candidatus Roizmanbacteria bacterium RIFCSPLOWO2_02_FULL_39_8]